MNKLVWRKELENGVFQSDGTFVKTDPVARMTPVTTTNTSTAYVTGGAAMGILPLASPINSTTTTTKT